MPRARRDDLEPGVRRRGCPEPPRACWRLPTPGRESHGGTEEVSAEIAGDRNPDGDRREEELARSVHRRVPGPPEVRALALRDVVWSGPPEWRIQCHLASC